jgi:hypothetical protein
MDNVGSGVLYAVRAAAGLRYNRETVVSDVFYVALAEVF